MNKLKKVLFVNSCARSNSRTLFIAKYLLNRFKKCDFEIETLNLESEGLLPLGKRTLQMREKFVQERDFSNLMFEYAKQWADADYIVIAAPYWDLSFPASLKNYIEHITIPHLTFKYIDEGKIQGLCKCKKLFYVTASSGPIVDFTYGYGYIKSLCETFYGINDVVLIKADAMDFPVKKMETVLYDVRLAIDQLEI